MFSKRRSKESETNRRQVQERASGPRIDFRSIALGLKAGLFGTVVMTIFRMPISDSLPPTARFYAKYVGSGEPADYPVQGLLLHLLYGMAGGGVFGALPITGSSHSEVGNERRAILAGVVYGLALSVFGNHVVLRGLLDMDPKPDERFIFHASHAVYGLALGAMFGSRASHRDGD